MAPKKTSSVSVVDGKVTVNLGIRMSADFQSASYDLGLTLPIMDGETPEAAMQRVTETAVNHFSDASEDVMSDLAGVISTHKQDFKAKQK